MSNQTVFIVNATHYSQPGLHRLACVDSENAQRIAAQKVNELAEELRADLRRDPDARPLVPDTEAEPETWERLLAQLRFARLVAYHGETHPAIEALRDHGMPDDEGFDCSNPAHVTAMDELAQEDERDADGIGLPQVWIESDVPLEGLLDTPLRDFVDGTAFASPPAAEVVAALEEAGGGPMATPERVGFVEDLRALMHAGDYAQARDLVENFRLPLCNACTAPAVRANMTDAYCEEHTPPEWKRLPRKCGVCGVEVSALADGICDACLPGEVAGPRVLVSISDGMLLNVISDTPIRAFVLDYDCENLDPTDLIEVPDDPLGLLAGRASRAAANNMTDSAAIDRVLNLPTIGEAEVEELDEDACRALMHDWQYEVANGDTKRGFREWCAAQREMNAEGE